MDQYVLTIDKESRRICRRLSKLVAKAGFKPRVNLYCVRSHKTWGHQIAFEFVCKDIDEYVLLQLTLSRIPGLTSNSNGFNFKGHDVYTRPII
jgi:hypothetical protein